MARKLLIAALIGVLVAVAALVSHVAGAVREAHGQALFASYGAWSRIREYAQASGKPAYVAEADRTVVLIESELRDWMASAYADGIDLAPYAKLQVEAYNTTARNLKQGENPLAHLDSPSGGTAGSGIE